MSHGDPRSLGDEWWPSAEAQHREAEQEIAESVEREAERERTLDNQIAEIRRLHAQWKAEWEDYALIAAGCVQGYYPSLTAAMNDGTRRGLRKFSVRHRGLTVDSK